MSPSSEGIVKGLDDKYVGVIVKFLADVENGKVQGSNNVALKMVELLEQVISNCENATALELCTLVRACGRLCQNEPVAANMARRVLRAIRDECRVQANQSSEGGESLQRLVLGATNRRGTMGPAHDIRPTLRDHIAELRTELESSSSSICSLARSLVGVDELILTVGAGVLTERFLRSAANSRCRIVVTGTSHESECMTARLATAGVSVTFISPALIFGIMARVNKVVIGVRAVLAGGAAVSTVGTLAATTAAKHYSVPVLAVAPLYKLTPLYASEQHQFNSLATPAQSVSYENAESVENHAYAPSYDLIPPDHVSLFVTNLGGHSPSYIYRLLSELYDPNDYQFE